MKNYKPIIVLFSICVIISAALAFVNSLTKEKIEQAEREKITLQVKSFFPETLSFDDDAGIYTCKNGNKIIGYCVITSQAGYGGDITVITAFSPEKTVVGVDILSESETPGIGKKINDRDFLAAFKENQVNTISQATISSSAVIDAVEKAKELLGVE